MPIGTVPTYEIVLVWVASSFPWKPGREDFVTSCKISLQTTILDLEIQM